MFVVLKLDDNDSVYRYAQRQKTYYLFEGTNIVINKINSRRLLNLSLMINLYFWIFLIKYKQKHNVNHRPGNGRVMCRIY